jgi:hypothetical protein
MDMKTDESEGNIGVLGCHRKKKQVGHTQKRLHAHQFDANCCILNAGTSLF